MPALSFQPYHPYIETDKTQGGLYTCILLLHIGQPTAPPNERVVRNRSYVLALVVRCNMTP